MEETGENHWPTASHWHTLSHNVVSSTPCGIIMNYEKKVIVNNSANINKLNHHRLPLTIEHKQEHNIYGEGNPGPGLRQALNVL